MDALVKGIGVWKGIGCLRLTPARGGVTAICMLGGEAVDGKGRRRGIVGLRRASLSGQLLASEGAQLREVCPAHCQGRRRREVAMTTEVGRERRRRRPENIHVPERSCRDAEDVVLMFRSRRRVDV